MRIFSASDTIAFGIHIDSHSEARYQELPRKFHFLRFRSKPSTFNATGVPVILGIQVKIALAALQYRATSWRLRRRSRVETKVCAIVSKYLRRIVGRYRRST